MPLITPFSGHEFPEEVINEVLLEGGVPGIKPKPKLRADSKFTEILDQNGASIADAAETIAEVLVTAKHDSNKLRAAELILDLHGVRDKDGTTIKQPIFQFFIKDPTVNINNIFMPIRNGSLPELEEPAEQYDENS